ncbi:MAG: flagellin [Lachnospiraceae bacterium]|nr:flagellin [Lachnospiraceae bacterium]
MGLTVQHNMTAMNANRNLGITNGGLAKSTEKLSSGYRINRAGDDAAGLAISEKMRGQIRGLNKASENAENGISLIQTAEGALQETQNIIQRMRELAVQAANDTATDDDRQQIQQEIDNLTQEVDRIANTSEYNTMKLLDGTQAGAQTWRDGSVAAEGTFKNGDVRIVISQGGDVASCTKFMATDDVIRIEFQKDITDSAAISSGAYTVKTLNGSSASVTISDTNINFAKTLSVTGTKTAIAATATKYDYGYTSGAGISFSFAISGVTNIKAGDVITISLKAANLVSASKTGEEALRLQIGANSGQEVDVHIASMKAKDLGIVQTERSYNYDSGQITKDIGEALDVTSQATASLAINAYDSALKKVSSERANLGAMQNRLEHTINNLDTSSENLQSAESGIRDTDMATEMTNYSKNNILMQAGQSMLAQANQSNQGVLSLLG